MARKKKSKLNRLLPITRMGRGITFVVAFALIGVATLFITHAFTIYVPPTSNWRDKVVWNATAQIGATEFSSQVMQYTSGNKEPWCADFVSWVYWQSGKPFSNGIGGWRDPSVSSLRDYFVFTHTYHSRTSGYYPVAGDVVIFSDNEHTGIVTGAIYGLVNTIEGNILPAKNPNQPGPGINSGVPGNIAGGDSVSRARYSLGDSRIVGYGHL